MANFISISGPSATGKTSLINELSCHTELRNAIFIPDPFYSVWENLVAHEVFAEHEDISRDSDYLCIFILKVIEKYKYFIDKYKDSDSLIIFDTCWVDISIYSIMNMWYNHTLKDIQEKILSDLSQYDEDFLRIYITKMDEEKQPKDKYRVPFRRYNIKNNRNLEIEYYRLATHLKNASAIPHSDLSDASLYIIEDLKKLGYL